MKIDARDLELQELLKKLKEILESEHGCNVYIEILINSLADTKKITAFVLMSGCTTKVDNKDGYYVIRIEGVPCCS